MRVLTYTKSAVKALRKMPKADSGALLEKLESYAKGERQDVVKLQGSDLCRLRHGDWRALLSITKNEITVATVLHRREAYKLRG